MKIIRDEHLATLTLVPVDLDEEEVVVSLAAMLKPEDKLVYGGRGQDSDNNEFCVVYLHAGSQKEERTEEKGNITMHEFVHVGGIKLILQGSAEEDKREVGRIRDICYYGSSGLIFLGETVIEGKQALTITAKRCKVCNKNMIRRVECEWSICDECAAKCEHKYVLGAIHGGGVNLGVGEYCDICGRGKPKLKTERQKSEIEHFLAAERELGMMIICDVEGIVMTPTQVVQMNRIARRYAKAQQRQLNASLRAS